jgi:hypothetical protein
MACCLCFFSSDRGNKYLSALDLVLPLVDLEEKDTFEGPFPTPQPDVKGYLDILWLFLKCKNKSGSPLASGCRGWVPFPRHTLLTDKQAAEARPALQPARCQAGPPCHHHLPTGRRWASCPSSPGSALGTVLSFLPWSWKAVTLKLPSPSTRGILRPVLRPSHKWH